MPLVLQSKRRPIRAPNLLPAEGDSHAHLGASCLLKSASSGGQNFTWIDFGRAGTCLNSPRACLGYTQHTDTTSILSGTYTAPGGSGVSHRSRPTSRVHRCVGTHNYFIVHNPGFETLHQKFSHLAAYRGSPQQSTWHGDHKSPRNKAPIPCRIAAVLPT